MDKLDTTQDAIGDVAQALGDVVVEGAELVADIATDLTDVAEAAATTVASTGRAGIRIIARTLRFVARRPREVVIGIVVVGVVVGVLGYLKSQPGDATSD